MLSSLSAYMSARQSISTARIQIPGFQSSFDRDVRLRDPLPATGSFSILLPFDRTASRMVRRGRASTLPSPS
jgi:hypothetical protein